MKRLMSLVAGAAAGVLMLVAMPVWAVQKGIPAPVAGSRTFTPGYLGVYLVDVTPQAASQLNLKQPDGAEIMGVDRDAPAGKAGLLPHDVIVGVGKQAVTSAMQLRSMLHKMPAGRTIHLHLIRDGKPKEVEVKLASRAKVEASAWPKGVIFTDGFPISGTSNGLAGMADGNRVGPDVKLQEFAMVGCDGLEVEPISQQLAKYFGVPQGMGLLVRSVQPASEASAAGLQAGDVITAVNGMPSSSLRGWLMVVSQNQGKTVQLKVIRNHQLKLLQYTPGGHRSQSWLARPQIFERHDLRVSIGPSGSGLGWVWTESSVSQTRGY